jgi:hypothetical protein
MTHVYTLLATGYDGLTGEFARRIETSTCFASRELANSRVAAFEAKILESEALERPITITVVAHEVIYE